jgi:XTP/dITP diphosphohydrolase
MSRATLLIATRNAHKAREIRQVLAGDFQFLTLLDFPAAPEVVEDGATFAANASKKAAALAAWLVANGPATPHPPSDPSNLNLNPDLNLNLSTLAPFHVLADDSGLEVDALGGAPGVHSARFAALDTGVAGNSPDAANNAKLLRLLARVPLPRRAARFRCVIALKKLPDPCILFEGVCPGHISLQPAGAGGFGYDPLFVPDGFDKSFAELGDTAKNTLSHRALALQKLRQYLASPPAAAP